MSFPRALARLACARPAVATPLRAVACVAPGMERVWAAVPAAAPAAPWTPVRRWFSTEEAATPAAGVSSGPPASHSHVPMCVMPHV